MSAAFVRNNFYWIAVYPNHTTPIYASISKLLPWWINTLGTYPGLGYFSITSGFWPCWEELHISWKLLTIRLSRLSNAWNSVHVTTLGRVVPAGEVGRESLWKAENAYFLARILYEHSIGICICSLFAYDYPIWRIEQTLRKTRHTTSTYLNAQMKFF